MGVRKFGWFVLCLLVLAIPGLASAQEGSVLIGSLSKQYDTVTKVMVHANCDITWLSRVVADTSINPAKLRSLPVGLDIRASGDACKGIAPQHVANLSRLLVRMDSAGPNKALQAEIEQLRNSAITEAARLKSVADENIQLKQQVQDLGAQLDKVKATQQASPVQVPMQAERASSFWGFILSGALGAALACFLTILGFGFIHKGEVSFQKKRVIKAQGEVRTLRLVGLEEKPSGSGIYIPVYSCECGDPRIFENNLIRHVTERCPLRDQVEVDVHPSFYEVDKARTA